MNIEAKALELATYYILGCDDTLVESDISKDSEKLARMIDELFKDLMPGIQDDKKENIKTLVNQIKADGTVDTGVEMLCDMVIEELDN